MQNTGNHLFVRGFYLDIVSIIESSCYLRGEMKHLALANAWIAPLVDTKCFSGDVLHLDIEVPVDLPGIENPQNILMIEPRGQLRFLPKARIKIFFIGERGFQYFENPLQLKSDVIRCVYIGGTALTYLLEYVAIPDTPPNKWIRISRRCFGRVLFYIGLVIGLFTRHLFYLSTNVLSSSLIAPRRA